MKVILETCRWVLLACCIAGLTAAFVLPAQPQCRLEVRTFAWGTATRCVPLLDPCDGCTTANGTCQADEMSLPNGFVFQCHCISTDPAGKSVKDRAPCHGQFGWNVDTGEEFFWCLDFCCDDPDKCPTEPEDAAPWANWTELCPCGAQPE